MGFAILFALVGLAYAQKAIVIFSLERTGSTQLSFQLGRHPCVVDAFEFFNAKLHHFMDTHPVINAQRNLAEPGYLRTLITWLRENMPEGVFARRNEAPVEAIEAARYALCSEKDRQRAALGEQPCGASCSVVTKVFDSHLPFELAASLATSPSTTVVLLERDEAARNCSLEWARKRGDWRHTPHGVNRTRCPKFLPARPWYDMIQREVATAGRMFTYVPFAAWTDESQSENVLRSIWGAAGLEPAQTEVWPWFVGRFEGLRVAPD